MSPRLLPLTTLAASLVLLPDLGAQVDRPDSLRAAQRLDAAGDHRAARQIFTALVTTAPDPAARAAAERRLAMSYGYDGDCARVIELEERVIAYWKTRREAEPQNAHYQEGEMANEAARVCIDHGFLDEAERMYRRGSELGNAEPAPRTHPQSLWDFRLAHALGRLAARRGDTAEAARQVQQARRILDADSVMAEAQERYYPYLVGYVALYTGDLATAEASFRTMMVAIPNDPFQVLLLATTLEKKGDTDEAMALYRRAYEMSTGSNPPNVYTRTVTSAKLGLP
jgi:tetratricopeptide (TPR) repeat protein